MLADVLRHGASGLRRIIEFGVYRASTELHADINDAAAKVLYLYEAERDRLPASLIEAIDDCFDDYDEVSTREFVEYLIFDDSKENVLDFYRVELAKEELGISGSTKQILETADRYKHLLTGQVPVSCERHLLFSFMEQSRTEYDRVKIAMYLGIRSLAANGLAVTTQQAIQWRMMGCRNQADLDEVMKDARLAAIWTKWSSRYFYRQVMDDLINNKLILQMPYGRHTCISASIADDEKFVDAVATKIRRLEAKPKRERAKQQQKKLETMLKARLNTS